MRSHNQPKGISSELRKNKHRRLLHSKNHPHIRIESKSDSTHPVQTGEQPGKNHQVLRESEMEKHPTPTVGKIRAKLQNGAEGENRRKHKAGGECWKPAPQIN